MSCGLYKGISKYILFRNWSRTARYVWQYRACIYRRQRLQITYIMLEFNYFLFVCNILVKQIMRSIVSMHKMLHSTTERTQKYTNRTYLCFVTSNNKICGVIALKIACNIIRACALFVTELRIIPIKLMNINTFGIAVLIPLWCHNPFIDP